jgi:uncharacterized protein YacL
MITQLTRFIFATAGALAGLAVKNLIDWTSTIGYPEYFVIILFVILGCAIGFIFGGIIGRELQRGYNMLESYIRGLAAPDLTAVTIGMIVGLVFALLLTVPLRFIQPEGLAFAATVMVYVLCLYFGVKVANIKASDFGQLVLRARGVRGELAERAAHPVKILDTSTVIDGRFAELSRAGFLEGPLRLPRFVLAELQTLADSADDGKRARGRRGLDLLATLQGSDGGVEVFETDYPEIPDVDSKLVRLAKDLGGTVVTIDYNLTQVARVQGVSALNINELASALRPNHLPGEVLHIDISRDGKEADQGVGYLEDGTMVVVQGGREKVGTDADVVITSVLQTSAGRMVFSKLRAGA